MFIRMGSMAASDILHRFEVFLARQRDQFREHGLKELKRKIKRLFNEIARLPILLLVLPFALITVLIMRVISPFYIVRFNRMIIWRIGHFAANVELYLCEMDAGINRPEGHFIDVWYYPSVECCNKQLLHMWKRLLHMGPGGLLAPIVWINSLIPGGDIHQIGNNTKGDIDVHNLLDRFPPHLGWLPEEEKRGESGLRDLGIPEGAPFVCLLVRDSGYLHNQSPHLDWSRHDHRDCDIRNYIQAAQELAKRGYYVVRMGKIVKKALNVEHPMIIDYATNGMRSDFMDIYLGAKCAFCISNGSGFDAVPYIFRRPVLYVDYVPLGLIYTGSMRYISTTKKHWLRDQGRFMTFNEIFDRGLGYSTHSGSFYDMGVELIESTPEEVTAAVLEMEERLNGTWETTKEDEELQRWFWEMFPESEWHGEIRSRIGADFLQKHKGWFT